MATNLRPLARKLQTALAIQQKRRFSISQYQAWSTKAGRMVTKYVVAEYIPDQGPRGKYVNKLSTWSFPDVVKFLASELQGGR